VNLREIREKFVEMTGRYDLVLDASTYPDNGANFWINAGQKWLDRQLDFSEAKAELTVSLSTGDFEAEVPGVRAVKSVGVKKDSDTFVYLEKRGYRDLRRYSRVADTSDREVPRYYAIGLDASTERDGVRELLIWPPADKAYDLEVEGLFATPHLEEDTDTSFWTLEFPEVLIKAAAFRAEPMFRNSTGENDFFRSLQRDVEMIDFDQVEEETTDVDQMKSGWRNIVD